MDEPICAGKEPAILELQPGAYWWCACGRSKGQPWCDGSHKETSFLPIKVELVEKTRLAMCLCKRSGKAPYCDGTHRNC